MAIVLDAPLILLAMSPIDCAGGVGTPTPMGRVAVPAAIMQGKPCRVMACSPGSAVLAAAVHAVGTSG